MTVPVCPLCHGSGRYTSSFEELKAQAHEMRQSGMTLRAIAKVLGKKGPGSIAHLLKHEPKTFRR